MHDKAPHPPDPHQPPSLERLRDGPDNPHLFGGYAPLVVGVVLFVLMVLLLPTVAPEQVVERPAETTSTTAP